MLSNAHKLLLRYSSHTAWTSLMLTWQLDTSERDREREGEVKTLDAKLKFVHDFLYVKGQILMQILYMY